MTTTTTAVEVGTFMVASWGYDQTNVDFYKVVGMTASGKSVKVQRWSSTMVEDNGPTTYVAPGEGPLVTRTWWASDGSRLNEAEETVAAIETKRLGSYGPAESPTFYIRLTSYSSAGVWDGKPKYETGCGYGH